MSSRLVWWKFSDVAVKLVFCIMAEEWLACRTDGADVGLK